jgi:hypothetical protein
MGYDGAISGTVSGDELPYHITGTELINSGNVKRVTSNTSPSYVSYVENGVTKSIYPFRDNQGFTIAIDY